MALAPTTATVATKLASITPPAGYGGKAAVSGYDVSTVDVTVSALQATVGANKYYNYTINFQNAWLAEGAPTISATDLTFSQAGLTTAQKTAGLISVATQNGPGATPTAPNNMTVLASDATHVLLGFQSLGSGTYLTYYLISQTTQDSAVPADFPTGAVLTYSNAAFSPPPPACFHSGTHLRTEHGETRVEDLLVGDLVAVIEGTGVAMKPVTWIGHRRIEVASYPEAGMVLPVRIRHNAFADGIPARDLLVSPDHAIFVDGVLVPAKLLVNGGSILQDPSFQRVHYFHVELEQHSVLIAEGLAAESYLDGGNRHSFENSANTVALRADPTLDRAGAAAKQAACHPMAEDAARVQPIWHRLAERSAGLGFVAQTRPTVTDPDLLVTAAGRALTPLSRDNGSYVFVLPADATVMEVVSRSTIPGELQPWLADRRRLGVAIGRISLRCGAERTDIALDSPNLGEGWWAMEQHGHKAWRWTNGNAQVALPPALPGGDISARLLEVQVTGCLDYLVETAADSFLRAA